MLNRILVRLCRLEIACAVILAVLPGALPVYAALPLECGSLTNGYGPFDYRSPEYSAYAGNLGNSPKGLVEGAHFLPFVERLERGKTGALPGGDIDYTLRAVPNHPRALKSTIELALKTKTTTPPAMRYSVECWLLRALEVAPNDGDVHLLYGYYMLRVGNPGKAVVQLEAARDLNEESANVHYNLALAYFELKQYDKALASAHAAYARGFPLTGLKTRLQREGRWRDPSPASEVSAPVSASEAQSAEPVVAR